MIRGSIIVPIIGLIGWVGMYLSSKTLTVQWTKSIVVWDAVVAKSDNTDRDQLQRLQKDVWMLRQENQKLRQAVMEIDTLKQQQQLLAPSFTNNKTTANLHSANGVEEANRPTNTTALTNQVGGALQLTPSPSHLAFISGDSNASSSSSSFQVPSSSLQSSLSLSSSGKVFGGKYISFALSRSRPYRSDIRLHYACAGRTAATPREQLDRYFNFQAHLTTSLRVVVAGDSLGVELGKGLQVAGGAQREEVLEHVHWRNDRAGGREQEILSAARVNGGGIVAYWRILGFLIQRTKGRALPNSGKGWRLKHARRLLEYAQNHTKKKTFDALIFRVSHPWLHTSDVTVQNLDETVKKAKAILGIKTTILMTTPLNNNIMTVQDLNDFRAMNELIRTFANTTKDDVRLCDVERYADGIIRYNAETALGGNFTEPLFLHKLKRASRRNAFAQSIPQVCASRVPDGSTDCIKNSYFEDGLHLCMNTLGPRIYAAMACLIQCQSQDKPCEASCNDKYMSLNPIDSDDFQD